MKKIHHKKFVNRKSFTDIMDYTGNITCGECEGFSFLPDGENAKIGCCEILDITVQCTDNCSLENNICPDCDGIGKLRNNTQTKDGYMFGFIPCKTCNSLGYIHNNQLRNLDKELNNDQT